MSIRVPFAEMKETAKKAFLNMGLTEEQAETCASVHTASSADGVESHGMNRIPRFACYVRKGWVNLRGTPQLLGSKGAAENYDGQRGIGIINALFCANRASELAKAHGIGLVALKNTTHWMRGGTYAWKMAEAGCIGICWINTESCMPLWGSDVKSVGNNPFCVAIPREDGEIVVDMAMSQYAYGKLGVYRLAGKPLPYPGGFDRNGVLTSDPGAIEETMRVLPAGYWKGSSLAIALDLAAAAIAGGFCGTDMDEEQKGSCTGCCQIFIAIDPYLFGEKGKTQEMFNRRVAAADAAHPIDPRHPVRCPGENTLERRRKSQAEGVPVDEAIWAQVQALAAGNMDTEDIASH
ncbi:MAG: 3-dehydro-L-gulonate 2-dehydrogenase [Fretibacterium sp.]|nr:3-dehydro-L-gulonate 2-dehydrogenase [Fretibacterium sp.]